MEWSGLVILKNPNFAKGSYEIAKTIIKKVKIEQFIL